MGVRQRVVRQTITETVCDVCKQPVSDGDGYTGMLAVKATGARGRARQIVVAFHGACLARFTGTTGGSGSGRKAAKRTGTAKKTGRKKAAGRGRKSTARKAGSRKRASARTAKSGTRSRKKVGRPRKSAAGTAATSS